MSLLSRLFGRGRSLDRTEDELPHPPDSTSVPASDVSIVVSENLGTNEPSGLSTLAAAHRERHLSSAHLLFLSKFSEPCSIDRFRADTWTNVLCQTPESAARQLLADCLIEPGGAADKLSYRFKAAELKALLKSYGLKSSGRKEDLAARLAEVEGLESDLGLGQITVYHCTEAGIAIVREYVNAEAERQTLAYEATRDALARSDFRRAAETVAAYEASQVFKRGIGIDWTHYDASNDVDILERAFNSVPWFLDNLPEDTIRQVRIAAGLQSLWSARPKEGWYPAGFTANGRYDEDTLAQMVWYNATYHLELKQMSDVGFKWVRISGCNDDIVCGPCRKLQAKRHRIDSAPELPYAGCTAPQGCRCSVSASLEDR